mmetsp:Transcript_22877/g.53945  ORF Transcript_22877/g.53945 Transcript_22877/m.53945 type:complete len:288 (+) Transcript_22877:57-920(+)
MFQSVSVYNSVFIARRSMTLSIILCCSSVTMSSNRLLSTSDNAVVASVILLPTSLLPPRSSLDSTSERAFVTLAAFADSSKSRFPSRPDLNEAKMILDVLIDNKSSPLKNEATSLPRSCSTASTIEIAYTSSSRESLGATRSVNSLTVMSEIEGVARSPSPTGRANGNRTSSNCNLGGDKKSPMKGKDGSRGGVIATNVSVAPLRSICLRRISAMFSTSLSSSALRLSASSESRSLTASARLRPSSGTASRSTNTAPSFVPTDPWELFRRAKRRFSCKPVDALNSTS